MARASTWLVAGLCACVVRCCVSAIPPRVLVDIDSARDHHLDVDLGAAEVPTVFAGEDDGDREMVMMVMEGGGEVVEGVEVISQGEMPAEMGQIMGSLLSVLFGGGPGNANGQVEIGVEEVDAATDSEEESLRKSGGGGVSEGWRDERAGTASRQGRLELEVNPQPPLHSLFVLGGSGVNPAHSYNDLEAAGMEGASPWMPADNRQKEAHYKEGRVRSRGADAFQRKLQRARQASGYQPPSPGDCSYDAMARKQGWHRQRLTDRPDDRPKLMDGRDSQGDESSGVRGLQAKVSWSRARVSVAQ